MNKDIVAFKGHQRHAIEPVGSNILEAAIQAEVGVAAVCAGRGLCGKCRVIILEGSQNLVPATAMEMMSLSEEEMRRGHRLACCATIIASGKILVDVPPESSVEQQRLLAAGIETPVSLDPAVKKCLLRLTAPTLERPRSDVEILLDALSRQADVEGATISHSALTQLPAAIREGNCIVTITIHQNGEIISVESGDRVNRLFGLAVDIGSTKIAAYLVNLNEGKVVATASSENPQIPFGTDIISRISHASKDEHSLKQLHGVIIAELNRLLHSLCLEARATAEEVLDMTVVGNTAMHHLFLRINPKFVALSPYTPVVRSSVYVRTKELGLKTSPGAYVYTPPIVAGFVGADAVADVLATELYKSDSPALMIDIGTNTEIVMNDGHRLIACSCASGPALEGGGIENGIRAETGAIEKVYIDPQTLEPGYKTVGDTAARGICGSGIVDAVASMLKSGIIDRNGRINFELKTTRIRAGYKQLEYVLAWKHETAIGREIVVNQHDIQAIQLAKAAIYAGTSILMAHLNLKARDIEQVFLAGAFGTYVDPQSALMIGMYPDIPLERIRFAGNAAGSGARMALLSRE